jgi:nucleoside-diphosphate-sugar epimerase
VTVLVFGVGYLGAGLVARLLADGQRVVGLENGFSTDLAAVERLRDGSGGRFELVRGDVREPAAVERAFDAARPVDRVYLLAAQASAHPDAAPAAYTEETNLRGPRHVFDAAVRHGAPPVVYASSFHVYGGELTGVVDEGRPYGRVRDLSHLSKIYAEKLAELCAYEMGLPVAPVRLGVVYGLGPVVKRDLRFVTVPHAFCLRALAGETLEIHPSGLRPLAFLHLNDAVEALVAAGAHAGYAPANAVGEVATALDVARAVERAALERGLEVRVREGTSPPGPLSQGERGNAARDRLIAGKADSAPAGFRVKSRLEAVGWRPAGRLDDPARGIPAILAHYAAGLGCAA